MHLNDRVEKICFYFNMNRSFWVGLFLFFITFLVFMPVINHEFVPYDDHLYVTENNMVKKGLTLGGLIWSFTNISAGFWFPLTWLSHMLDCQIFGLNPGGHHFMSLLLHTINVLMLFYLFKKMTGALLPSLLVAVIFAVHPLHVEPVAWASSRKDVLSTFFWMLTMLIYIRYVKRGSIKSYLLVLLSFSMGLMAKPMLVTLPFILLLLDYWPLCRIDAGQSCNKLDSQAIQIISIHTPTNYLRLIVEKIPLFIFSLISVFITYFSEKDYGAVISLESLPIWTRLANAIVSYGNYIYESLLPIGLSVHYPPYGPLPIWKITVSFSLLIIISFISIKFHRRHPYLLFGWLWFLVTLLPVIGLIQIGSHSMADRYSYVPLIGLSIAFSWGLYRLLKKLRRIKIYPFICCIIILPLLILTCIQLGYWQNGITLFEHAVEVNKDDLIAHNNLGLALALEEREADAIAHFYRALAVKGMEHEVHFNIGNAFQSILQYDKAIAHYKAALAIDPEYIEASLNLGSVFYHLGKYDKAIYYFSNVLRINPDNAIAHNNLGAILAQEGNSADAISHFKRAIQINPGYETAKKNLTKVMKTKQ